MAQEQNRKKALPKSIHWAAHETLSLLPVVIFFFVFFNIINITQKLMVHEKAINAVQISEILIGSLVAGKVLLVVNLLPLTNVFSNRPLIYNTLWKTFLYSLAGLVYRLCERLFGFLLLHKNFAQAFDSFLTAKGWSRFWGVEIWVSVLLFFFVTFQELIFCIGQGRVRDLFFGRKLHHTTL